MIEWLGKQRRKQNQHGFTLIELLVVIIILGILAAVVVFAVGGVGDKGKAAAEKIDVRTIRTAEEAYCAQHGRYATEDELVAGGLLSEKSVNNYVFLTSGGTCGGDPAKVGSAYQVGLESPTETVNVAANADSWGTSDTGSGTGYASSAYAYTLNSNLYDPLIIFGSNYSLQPGLAASWELIPTNVNRATIAGMTPGIPAPLSFPHDIYTNSTLNDRPYNAPTWRFHLRQGAKFHDNSDFDADDVIWTWRDRQPINASNLSTVTASLGFTHKLGTGTPDRWDSVEKIDQFTVDFTPKTANLRLPEQIGHPKGAIVPATGVATDISAGNTAPNTLGTLLSTPRTIGKHFDGATGGLPGVGGPTDNTAAVTTRVFNTAGAAQTPAGTARVDGHTTANPPIGTGPFRWVSYTFTVPQGGGSASFDEYPTYWGAGAQVKRMNYTFLPLATQRASGLLSGQYDYAIDLDALDVQTVKNSGNRVVTASYGQNSLLYVNKVVKDSQTIGSFDPARVPTYFGGPDSPGLNYRFNIGTDPAVRKAFSLAIDRADYVNTVYAGNAAPGRWMAPPNILGIFQNDVPALSFGQGAARTALDAAGWTCGAAAPGLGTVCALNEIRTWRGVNNPAVFTTGRELRIYMVGTPDVPQTGYDLMVARAKDVGIKLVYARAECNSVISPAVTCPLGGVTRSQMYASVLWDMDLELPNQNDANPAFLPVLRMACLTSNGNYRFAPVDGINGVGPSETDIANNGLGSFPFGRNPCGLTTGTGNPAAVANTTGPTFGAFDNIHYPASNSATTTAGAQSAAAQMMRILVNQDQPTGSVVIPLAGQFRIYGMKSTLNLTDPHPSQTSQRWQSLTKDPSS